MRSLQIDSLSAAQSRLLVDDRLLFSKRFFRIAAVCSFVSALTTLGLIFLHFGYPAASNLEERMFREAHPVYRLYLWVAFTHPFFTLTAALAVGVNLARRAAGIALAGFTFFFIWGSTEIVQQSLTLVGRHQVWSNAYARAVDPASRATIANYVTGLDAVSESLYAVIVVTFLLGNLFYAIASWGGTGLIRYVSCAYLAASTLTFFYVGEAFGQRFAPSLVDWAYPAIQPLARGLIGVWLWRTGDVQFGIHRIRGS